MTRPETEIRAEMDRMKVRVLEFRFLSRVARTRDDRTDHSIEAAYAAIIVGALAYALGETPTSATRVKIA